MAKLTARQQRFCDEYLIDLNATQAAIRSGYSEKNARNIACENLAKPNIAEYIQKRMAEKEKGLIADQDEILRYLTAVLRGEETDERTALDKDGKLVKIPVRFQTNQIKAAELLGKRYGIWVDRVENDVDMELNITIDYGEEK